MTVSGKTKKQLMDEIAILKLKISEMETAKGYAGHKSELGERLGRYFPQVDHMQEAIYVIFDRKYEFINNKFTDMFGFTRDEICQPGFNPRTLIAPESRNLISEKHQKGSRGEFSADQYEFTGMTKNGTRIECETFVLFIPYKWGIAIHGMLRDISVHKRISEELQRHRSDLQIVLNSIPTSIFYTDHEHHIIQANNAFCKYVGFPLDHILNKTFSELFPNLPAEQLSYFYETSNQVMSSGVSKRGFVEILPSVRGRRWIQNDRIPHLDDNGNIIGVICLAIDISDLRETEDKLLYMSLHDVLTGLYNRTYFEEELTRLEKGRQFPISIIAIRVDDLCTVNDSKGIAAGNELLKSTAKIMKIFRSEDVVARIAGDRFAAIMPSSGPPIGEDALIRLGRKIHDYNTHHTGMPLNLSISLASGEKGCSLFDVLKEAEAALS